MLRNPPFEIMDVSCGPTEGLKALLSQVYLVSIHLAGPSSRLGRESDGIPVEHADITSSTF